MSNEIKEILDFKENTDYKKLSVDEITILRDYITNLQQAIEVKNERIKEEQQEKERYIKFYNELNIWNKELQEENANLKTKIERLNNEIVELNIKLEDRAFEQLKTKIKMQEEENKRLKEDYKRVVE